MANNNIKHYLVCEVIDFGESVLGVSPIKIVTSLEDLKEFKGKKVEDGEWYEVYGFDESGNLDRKFTQCLPEELV